MKRTLKTANYFECLLLQVIVGSDTAIPILGELEPLCFS